MIELKTQEDRWRALLDGYKLRITSWKQGDYISFQNGELRDEVGCKYRPTTVDTDGWELYEEPPKPIIVTFECEWLHAGFSEHVYPDITNRDGRFSILVGKGKFKVTCEQIIETKEK